jgi:hypothetical protein
MGNKIMEDFGVWFAKCAIIGSIPGLIVWTIFWYYGNN